MAYVGVLMAMSIKDVPIATCLIALTGQEARDFSVSGSMILLMFHVFRFRKIFNLNEHFYKTLMRHFLMFEGDLLEAHHETAVIQPPRNVCLRRVASETRELIPFFIIFKAYFKSFNLLKGFQINFQN